MTSIRRYTYSHPRISKMQADTTSGFVWLAFEKDSSGICHVKKCSANDLSQVYFDIEIETERILDLKVGTGSLSDYIFVMYEHDDIILTEYRKTNPLSSYTHFYKPFGVPTPLEMAFISSNVYVLFPDASGGVTPKILKFTSGGSLSETIELSTLLESSEAIYSLTSMTSDSSSNLWLVTYTNPVQLIRVWFASGGWNMQIKSIS